MPGAVTVKGSDVIGVVVDGLRLYGAEAPTRPRRSSATKDRVRGTPFRALVVAPGVGDAARVGEGKGHSAGQVVAEFAGGNFLAEFNPPLGLGDSVVHRQAVGSQPKADSGRKHNRARRKGVDDIVVLDPVLRPGNDDADDIDE